MTRASAKNTSHIRVCANPAGTALTCEHCRAEWPVKFPQTVNAFAKLCKAFETMHVECKPATTP